MKISQVFKIAKEHLYDGSGSIDDKNVYICNAISQAFFLEKITSEGCAKAKYVIQKAIHPCHTIDAWLLKNNHITSAERRRLVVRNSTELQRYRHAWLDHLIAEYEAKGK